MSLRTKQRRAHDVQVTDVSGLVVDEHYCAYALLGLVPLHASGS